MKKLVVSVLVMIAMLATMNSAMAYTYEEPVKSSKLPRTTPLEKGIDPSYLYDMLDQLEQAGIEMHSLLVSVDNEVIFEGFWNPYGPDTPHIVHSLTKLFTNAAAGVAVTNGDLSLDDRLIDMFPELAPENPSENLQKVTLRYLITMNGGYGRMISGSEWRPLKTSWLEAFFAEPVPYEPGTHYQYSSGNAYAVSAMVQKATGKTCLELLLESGFSELGMEHFTWDLSPEGICSGGNGVSCTTEDMLKVGNLFLNMGQWNGKQILTEEWCRMAIGIDKVYEGQGDYAFHWTDKHDGNYTAGGAYGQIVILVPELNMVVAGTAGTKKTDEEYDIINSAMIAPAKADKAMQETVAAKEQTLNLLQNPILTDSPIAEKVDEKVFKAEENEDGITSIKLDVEKGYIDFIMVDQRGEHTIRNGIGEWMDGGTTMTGNYLHHQYQNEIEPYTAYGEWKDDTTLQLTWRYPSMAFVDTVEITFSEDGSQMTMVRSVNVNSGALVRPAVTLKAE